MSDAAISAQQRNDYLRERKARVARALGRADLVLTRLESQTYVAASKVDLSQPMIGHVAGIEHVTRALLDVTYELRVLAREAGLDDSSATAVSENAGRSKPEGDSLPTLDCDGLASLAQHLRRLITQTVGFRPVIITRSMAEQLALEIETKAGAR